MKRSAISLGVLASTHSSSVRARSVAIVRYWSAASLTSSGYTDQAKTWKNSLRSRTLRPLAVSLRSAGNHPACSSQSRRYLSTAGESKKADHSR